MYLLSSDFAGLPTAAASCAGWERDAESFSKVVAEHYARTELGLRSRGERIWCAKGGKLCHVTFPGDVTVAVSFAKVPEYVIARRIFVRDAPRREYNYECPPNGGVILRPRR
jgi:hypothetical protein